MFSRLRSIRYIAAIGLLVCLSITVTNGEMALLTDEELSKIKGDGITKLTDYTGTDNAAQGIVGSHVVRMSFDIYAELYAEIDQLKLGYYTRTDLRTWKYSPFGGGNNNSNYFTLLWYSSGYGGDTNMNFLDWDVHWSNVTFGQSATAPLRLDGILFKVYFNNWGSTGRKIRRVTLGSPNVTGQFVGSIERMTGFMTSNIVYGDWIANIWWKPIKVKRDPIVAPNWDYFILDDDAFFLSLVNYDDHLGFELTAGFNGYDTQRERYIEFDYQDSGGYD